jgi:hypothetical protein
MPQVETYDLIAADLAEWLEDMSTQLAIAFSPQGIAPFAAPISEQQKLAYYSSQLFNQDGTPNDNGRNAELQRLGPIGFRTVYRAVIQAYPWLKLPAPPEGAAPSPLGPTPQPPPEAPPMALPPGP